MMVCVMVAMTATMPSYAQRLIPRQNSVELVGSMPIIKGERPVSYTHLDVYKRQVKT